MIPTGTLVRSHGFYPYPGFTSATVPRVLAALPLTSTLVYLPTIVAGAMHMATWNITTDVVTDLGSYLAGVTIDTQVTTTPCCWNADKSKIYIFCSVSGAQSTFDFYVYDLAANTMVQLGSRMSMADGDSTGSAEWDPVLGTILVGGYQGSGFFTFDPATQTFVQIGRITNTVHRAYPTTNYIYAFCQSGGPGTTGTLIRCARSQALFSQNLAGVCVSGNGASYTAAMPYYANLELVGRCLAANDAGEVVFNSGSDLFHLGSTQTVTRFVTGIGSCFRILYMPNGNICILKDQTSAYVYS
jgi:hypothetical protein